MRREWVDRVDGYDERLGAGSPGRAAEDVDLFYRLLRAGAHIRYEPAAIVYHERQSTARRAASRWGYGHGIGAFCALWLLRGDPYSLRILAQWMLDQSRALAEAVRAHAWIQARHRLLSLRGTLRGLLYGLLVAQAPARLPPQVDLRDAHPDQPV
jgi:GT2 family glycosyltransferase